MNKKHVALLLAVVLLLMTVSACGTPPKQTVSSDTITITDHLGDTVTVPKKIERIVVCDIYPLPSVLSIFFNSADKIVGMPEASMSAAKNSLLGELYPEIETAQTGFIKGTTVNIEEILKLDPDVVFYSASSQEEGQLLKNAGLNAVAISVNKWEYNAIETLNHWISLLAQIFPEDRAKAERVSNYSAEVYDLVQSRVKNLPDAERVPLFFLFQYSETVMMTSGQHFFGQWWADAIGAKNVATELSGDNAATVNMEQVYTWNPKLIFITNFTGAQPGDLFENTIGTYNWSGVDAVKNKKVYKMPLGMYRSYTPGVDTPITLLWLAKTVYPALFEDIDIKEKTKDYYKTVFDVTLTDAQAERIFQPVSESAAGVLVN